MAGNVEHHREALIAAACAVRAHAHAPYSGFAVGAAVLDEQGRIHAGANVENAAYPQGWCAETSALAALVAAGGRRVLALAVCAVAKDPVAPCGGCRQKLREFAAADCPVWLAGPDGLRATHSLGALLPHGFGPHHLPTCDAEAVARTAALLRQRLGPRAPRIAVLLGSGWSPLAAEVQDAVDLPYAELPAFPVLAVGGHAGLLRAGRLGGVDVLVLAGRQHAYETGRADGMKGAIRTLAAIGIRVLVQTNAAGSLDAALRPGEVMLVGDHINVPQLSPLFGESGDDRFVDLSAAYDPALREQARAAADRAGLSLHEGVYAWVTGPQFETPAEIRMLRSFGARAVGMSTVPETILARHAGLRVLALSLLTNLAAGMQAQTLSHAHTLAGAATGSERALRLLVAVLQALEC